MRFAPSFLLAFVLCLLMPLGVSAETAPPKPEERALIQLYQAQEKRSEADPYIEKRITEERTKIRSVATKEAQAIVSSFLTGTSSDQGAQAKAVDRQRQIVSALEDLRKDRTVDLDLLMEEEKKYYVGPPVGTGAINDLKTTSSHAELKARKAILEERISAIEAELKQQEDRLAKLASDERTFQLQQLFGYGSYALILVTAVVLDRLFRRRVVRRIQEKGRRYIVAKVLSATIYAIALFIIIARLISEFPGALASFAIIGAGIAVALQDVIKDIVGWMIILQRRLFTLGNRVSIGTHTGDVVDIGLLRTTMLEVSVVGLFNAHERTGKVLTVPNSLILRDFVLNYNATSDFMSVEMKVTVTYQSDWKNAEAILLQILREETSAYVEDARAQQKRRTALFYTAWEVGEPEVHTDLEASGVLFTLKCIVPIGHRRDTVTKITKRLLEAFAAAKNVHLAYQTVQVVH